MEQGRAADLQKGRAELTKATSHSSHPVFSYSGFVGRDVKHGHSAGLPHRKQTANWGSGGGVGESLEDTEVCCIPEVSPSSPGPRAVSVESMAVTMPQAQARAQVGMGLGEGRGVASRAQR